MQPAERIDEILNRYKGQDVYVVIEVLSVDKKSSQPLTSRLLGVTPIATKPANWQSKPDGR